MLLQDTSRHQVFVDRDVNGDCLLDTHQSMTSIEHIMYTINDTDIILDDTDIQIMPISIQCKNTVEPH